LHNIIKRAYPKLFEARRAYKKLKKERKREKKWRKKAQKEWEKYLRNKDTTILQRIRRFFSLTYRVQRVKKRIHNKYVIPIKSVTRYVNTLFKCKNEEELRKMVITSIKNVLERRKKRKMQPFYPWFIKMGPPRKGVFDEEIFKEDWKIFWHNNSMFFSSDLQKTHLRSVFKFKYISDLFYEFWFPFHIRHLFFGYRKKSIYSNTLTMNATTMFAINPCVVRRTFFRFIFFFIYGLPKNMEHRTEAMTEDESDPDEEDDEDSDYACHFDTLSMDKAIKKEYRKCKFVRKNCLKTFHYGFAINNLKKIAQLDKINKKAVKDILHLKNEYQRNHTKYTLNQMKDIISKIKHLERTIVQLNENTVALKKKLQKYL